VLFFKGESLLTSAATVRRRLGIRPGFDLRPAHFLLRPRLPVLSCGSCDKNLLFTLVSPCSATTRGTVVRYKDNRVKRLC